MFWEHVDWMTLPHSEAQAALNTIKRGLEDFQQGLFTWNGDDDPIEHRQNDSLLVKSIRVRPLRFYRDHWLYELQVSRAALGLTDLYVWARAFVVVGYEVSPNTDHGAFGLRPALPPHRRPPAPAATPDVTSLDFQSLTVHQLNDRAGLQLLLPDGSGYDRLRAVQYLDFFTSFLCNEEDGDGSPFCLVNHERPDQEYVADELPLFETALGKLLKLPSPYERPKRPAYLPADGSSADFPDTMGAPCDQQASPPATPESAAVGTLADRATQDGAGLPPVQTEEQGSEGPDTPAGTSPSPPEGPSEVIEDVVVLHEKVSNLEKGFRHVIRLKAGVLYGGARFHADFQLQIERDGQTGVQNNADVQMVDDQPMAGRGLRYRSERSGYAQTPLLFLVSPRKLVSASDFIKRLESRPPGSLSNPAGWVQSLRVYGDVELVSLERSLKIQVRDVEFLGRIVLSDCHRGASVIFRECKFAKALEAKNLFVDGDLDLCHTRGLDSQSTVLDGMHLMGSFEAEGLALDSGLSADHARVEGHARLSGCDILGGVSCQNATFGAALDLSPLVKKELAPDKFVRSRIGADLRLSGLKASYVDLRGVATRDLDLSYANITGLLDLSPASCGDRWVRALFGGNVNLRSFEVKEIFFQGIKIEGDLLLIEANVHGCVFARPQEPSPGSFRFRVRVAGSVEVSGADIEGDCDFDCAWIGGAFTMRTGSLNRLFLSHLHWELEDGRVASVCTELGKLQLTGVQGLRRIALRGIQVRGGDDNEPAVYIEGMHVLGSVEFFSKENAEKALKAMGGSGTKKSPDEPEPAAISASPKSAVWFCQAQITGPLELRNTVVDGDLDLTNLKVVGGAVRLKDVRIGADLLSRSALASGKRPLAGPVNNMNLSCDTMELDRVHVHGDALLSGLTVGPEGCPGKDLKNTEKARVQAHGDARPSGPAEAPKDRPRGDLKTKHLKVGGRLDLAWKEHHARIRGIVDLTGVRAAELNLSGDCFIGDLPEVRLKLSGSVLGACDLGSKSLPDLDMFGIQVADWKTQTSTKDIEECLAILRRMPSERFDRMAWITVENRLRNGARIKDADRFYREMKKLEPARGLRRILKPLSHVFLGFGTRVWPSVALAAALAVLLYVSFRQPENVKASSGLLEDFTAACRLLEDRQVATPQCIRLSEAYRQDALSAEVSPHDWPGSYGFENALLLTVNYSIPLIGTLTSPDWDPVTQKQTVLSSSVHLPISPAILAEVVRLVNTLLLSLAAAFFGRRLFR